MTLVVVSAFSTEQLLPFAWILIIDTYVVSAFQAARAESDFLMDFLGLSDSLEDAVLALH